MQSSFPNLGYFHLWCLPWAGIIRIAVRVGRRQKLYRFLRHSEFGINNQFVCARRDEHRSGQCCLVLDFESKLWLQRFSKAFETWSSLRSGSVSITLHPTKINIIFF
jgi:hypothetical protein